MILTDSGGLVAIHAHAAMLTERSEGPNFLGSDTTFTVAEMSSHTSARSQYRELGKLDRHPPRRSPA